MVFKRLYTGQSQEYNKHFVKPEGISEWQLSTHYLSSNQMP